MKDGDVGTKPLPWVVYKIHNVHILGAGCRMGTASLKSKLFHQLMVMR